MACSAASSPRASAAAQRVASSSSCKCSMRSRSASGPPIRARLRTAHHRRSGWGSPRSGRSAGNTPGCVAKARHDSLGVLVVAGRYGVEEGLYKVGCIGHLVNSVSSHDKGKSSGNRHRCAQHPSRQSLLPNPGAGASQPGRSSKPLRPGALQPPCPKRHRNGYNGRHGLQVVYVPAQRLDGPQVPLQASRSASRAERAAGVHIDARNERTEPEPADFEVDAALKQQDEQVRAPFVPSTRAIIVPGRAGAMLHGAMISDPKARVNARS